MANNKKWARRLLKNAFDVKRCVGKIRLCKVHKKVFSAGCSFTYRIDGDLKDFLGEEYKYLWNNHGTSNRNMSWLLTKCAFCLKIAKPRCSLQGYSYLTGRGDVFLSKNFQINIGKLLSKLFTGIAMLESFANSISAIIPLIAKPVP